MVVFGEDSAGCKLADEKVGNRLPRVRSAGRSNVVEELVSLCRVDGKFGIGRASWGGSEERFVSLGGRKGQTKHGRLASLSPSPSYFGYLHPFAVINPAVFVRQHRH